MSGEEKKHKAMKTVIRGLRVSRTLRVVSLVTRICGWIRRAT